MIQVIHIEDILRKDSSFKEMPILDIRSPKEFAKGHLPGAVSFPLFTDEQRNVVGTIYHQQGRQAAILQGFDITGPKWSGFIRSALEEAPNQKVIVHCWRGGMRSEALAWALNLYGFDVFVIKGGYKSFRRWCYRIFGSSINLIALSGKTGANKTGLLRYMANQHYQVLDLEALACHQGSAYGSMGMLIQPSQEQFENNLAICLNNFESDVPVWVEDESMTIGRVAIPRTLWLKLCSAPVLELDVPLESRMEVLYPQYGILDKQFLKEATLKIKKRLGPDQTRAAIADIENGEMRSFIRRVLGYYDKAYQKSKIPFQERKWAEVLKINNPKDLPTVVKLLLEAAVDHNSLLLPKMIKKDQTEK